jgi:hypothetical protein
MEMLGDHFWPAMYPGIIVGLLLGLGGGNIISALLGAIGGLMGAMALFFVFVWLGLDDTIVALAGLLGGAAAGAFVLMRAGIRIRQALSGPAH